VQASSVIFNVNVTAPVIPVGGVNVGVNEEVLERPARAPAGEDVQATVTAPVVLEYDPLKEVDASEQIVASVPALTIVLQHKRAAFKEGSGSLTQANDPHPPDSPSARVFTVILKSVFPEQTEAVFIDQQNSSTKADPTAHGSPKLLPVLPSNEVGPVGL